MAALWMRMRMSEAVGVGIGWNFEKERVVVWVLRSRARWVEGRVDVDIVVRCVVFGEIEMIVRVDRVLRFDDVEDRSLDRRTLMPMFIVISQPCNTYVSLYIQLPVCFIIMPQQFSICVRRNRVTDRLSVLGRPPEFINFRVKKLPNTLSEWMETKVTAPRA
jgi:hypothetical protein